MRSQLVLGSVHGWFLEGDAQASSSRNTGQVLLTLQHQYIRPSPVSANSSVVCLNQPNRASVRKYTAKLNYQPGVDTAELTNC